MKVLRALEPCPSVYDGLWGTRHLLSDDISRQRMLLLRQSRKGAGRATVRDCGGFCGVGGCFCHRVARDRTAKTLASAAFY